MVWFCAVYPWCDPETFREMSYSDYLRLKPWVDLHRQRAQGGQHG